LLEGLISDEIPQCTVIRACALKRSFYGISLEVSLLQLPNALVTYRKSYTGSDRLAAHALITAHWGISSLINPTSKPESPGNV
jgi:hypothetical protein